MNRMIFTTVMASLWMSNVPNIHWSMMLWGLFCDFSAEVLSKVLSTKEGKS